MRHGILLAVLAVGAFGGGLVGSLIIANGAGRALAQPPNLETLPPPPPSVGGPSLTASDTLSERFSEVVRVVEPAVVSIEAKKAPKPGSASRKSLEESGSGFLVRLPHVAGTLVFTNNHVVADAEPGNITVHLSDDRVFRPSKVWADVESDVAVLRLDEDDLPVARIGDSAEMEVGRWVLAFGSPFGLSRTVTHGIISARQRGEISLGSSIRIKDFLQTDAAINPGSSGGPLVNLGGEVVGINTAIASQSGSNSGIAFAIPMNLARNIAEQLIRDGRVQRSYLGVQLAGTLDPAVALRLGLRKASGALVEVVYPDTPAAKAGLLPNDVILQVDDTPVRNENHLINMIASMPVGKRVRVQLWRDRGVRLAEVTVDDWSAAKPRLK